MKSSGALARTLLSNDAATQGGGHTPSGNAIMPYGMYIAAAGAGAQSKRMDVIANNLANIDTPGFKRELALFQARYAEEIERGLAVPDSGSINDLGGGVTFRETVTDFSAGPLKRTGLGTDFAIDGDAYFVVERDGRQLLTRAGNFQILNGRLVTQQGFNVLGDGGAPILIDGEEPWQLTSDGGISQAGSVTPLSLVRPASSNDLVKVGENLFDPQTEPQPVEPGDRRVVSGFLEASGARAVTEMMEMIEASRAFEMNVSLVRSHDELIGNLLGRLLRAPA